MSQRLIFQSVDEMPPMAVSLADMSFNKTGSWRYLRPIYQEKLAPCRKGCPAGTDLPRVLTLITEGKIAEAWALIKEANPFPGICGRVCYHPCEAACNRKNYDEPVAIQALERFVADACFDLQPPLPRVEKKAERVAIVGSGPAGLTCAYFLAREGFQVTIFEAESQPGGMLRVGIPPYRLPREVLDREIEAIAQWGVEFKLNTRIGEEVSLETLRQQYDAVFLATGAHRSRLLGIPGEELAQAGLEFLKTINRGEREQARHLNGRKVLVIGGGNTAMDVARTVLRLGAQPVVVYRRTRLEMPAIAEEIEEAEQEGVEFLFLTTPQAIRRREGKLEVESIRLQLGEPDASGRRRPVPIKGSEFVLEAGAVLTAIGEEPDLTFLATSLPDTDRDREVETGVGVLSLQGEQEGLFLGGDALTGPGTVVQAIAAGKKAAHMISRYLQAGQEEAKPPSELLSFELLNLDYFRPQPRVQPSLLPVDSRITHFSEVKASLPPEAALAEAKRCFSCGVCNFCDNCLVFCPDVAIKRKNEAYEIDLEFCKGCGVCAQECPRGVISLLEEAH